MRFQSRFLFSAFLSFILLTSSANAGNGVVTLPSQNTVKETADKLENLLKSKGMTVFIRVDHAKGAEKVGKKLRPTELVIFGNPKVGTPLMQCGQTMGLDLPQKVLIWQDQRGKVWLSYNDPDHLAEHHDLKGCETALKKVKGALNKFATAATRP